MKNNLKKVGVVFGGISAEHHVSIKSAQTIIRAFETETNLKKFTIYPFFFFVGPKTLIERL